MSVPKHKKTHSKTMMGRSHDALKIAKPATCPKCQSPIKSHKVCPNCGYYKGKQVIKSKSDVVLKREEKRKKVEKREKEKMAKLKN